MSTILRRLPLSFIMTVVLSPFPRSYTCQRGNTIWITQQTGGRGGGPHRDLCGAQVSLHPQNSMQQPQHPRTQATEQHRAKPQRGECGHRVSVLDSSYWGSNPASKHSLSFIASYRNPQDFSLQPTPPKKKACNTIAY